MKPTDRYFISISAVEVYMETVRDILVPRHKLRCPAAIGQFLPNVNPAINRNPARCSCGGMVLRMAGERIPQAAVVQAPDVATAHRLIFTGLWLRSIKV